MAISTVNVDFSAILQNAAQATGLLRVRLSQVGTVEDSETGDQVILPIAWQETTLTDGAATLALVPNKIIEPSCTYYEIQLKSVPDCPKACAKLLLSGIMYVPDEDCNVLDLLISPPSPETANTASGYASQAKQAAQVAEYFAVQAGDRYDDVAEAAATALTDIGTAKQDALDAIGTAQSGATEAISTAEDAALQAIGQARGTALDDIGTAQGTAIGAVQAEGNTQVVRVEDAGEDAVADVTVARDAAVSAVQAQQATSVVAVTAEGTRQTGLVTAEGTAQVNAVTQAGNGYVTTMQGLVSDAQAARDAAQTAQGLAEDAQTAAESASTEAQGYAGDASTSAGQAAQSASDAADSADDAADSATAAQASADSIAASAAQIQTNERNITNIQALLNGTLYREETDSTVAYSKTVPTGAMPYASIDEIGGRTVVWNQLVQNGDFSDGTTGWSKGGGVSSFSVANNVATLVFATGQTYNHYIGKSGVPMTNGHKYYVTGTFQSSSITQAFIQTSHNSQLVNVTGTKPVGKISSIFNNSQDTGKTSIYFRFADTTLSEEGTGTLSDCYLIDLTLLYGSGNEPSTVAEFEAMFPSIDPAYNAGELMSAGVTEVVSEGRNYLPLPTDMTPQTKNGVTVTPHADGTWTAVGTATANGNIVFAIPNFVVPAGYLHIRNNVTNPNFVSVLQDSNHQGLDTPVMAPVNLVSAITDTSVGKTAAFYGCFIVSGNTYNITWQPSIELTDAVTDYTPYRSPVSLPIPSSIQSLPGYGWSAGSAYNVISLAQGKNMQRVGSMDLGSLTYTKSSMGVGDVFVSTLSDAKPVSVNTDIFNGISSAFKTVSRATLNNTSSESLVALNTLAQLILYTTVSYTDATAFKSAMSGVMLYYELATPIETDISPLLTDSTIEVEPGGSLTFRNQHGDNFRIPVPNSETYLVQATPELPTTDGTYTLQCTVTDGTPSVTWVSV